MTKQYYGIDYPRREAMEALQISLLLHLYTFDELENGEEE